MVLLKMLPGPEIHTNGADLAARASRGAPGSWGAVVDARNTSGQMPSCITGHHSHISPNAPTIQRSQDPFRLAAEAT